MKTSKRKAPTRRSMQRIAKKVLRTAEDQAQKLLEGVQKKLRTTGRKTRAGKRPAKKTAAARPRKRRTSRARARAT